MWIDSEYCPNQSSKDKQNINTANKLFCKPNCSGVKEKLKIRFKINGKATIKAIFLCHKSIKTLPKEIAIKIYKNVQAGPNTHDGGAQSGFINCEYQLYVLFIYLKLTK